MASAHDMTTRDDGDETNDRRWGTCFAAFGGLLLVGGPVGGMGLTAFQMTRAFGAAKSTAVPPDDKAKGLANGIESAMSYTAVGIVIALFGLVLAGVGIAFLLRARRRTTAHQPTG